MQPGMTVVDATFGNGGHTEKIREAVGPQGRVIGIDVDENAIRLGKEKFKNEKNVVLVKANYSELANVLASLNIAGADRIFADFGWRAEQAEDASYGLSFQKKGPLDMRLGKEGPLTAGEIVNQWPAAEMAKIFRKFGEEKYAMQAVRAIVKFREEKKIEDTFELAGIIRKSIGFAYRKAAIDPATRIFQALRIAVNQEFDHLGIFLEAALRCLNQNGIIAVITFHSLEDQIVKRFFKANAGGCVCPPEFPVCICGNTAKVELLTKKPIVPGDEELRLNPRSRSAKLRVVRKLVPAEEQFK